MKSISVIVPAYNEENNLEAAVKKYERVVKELFDAYEIIIVNDGSTDNTFKVAESLKNPGVITVYHQKNKGLGGAFKKGIELAALDYIIMLSGEGDPSEEGVRNILSKAGEADIIISYIQNENERPWYRRLATKVMTEMINLRFGLKIRYYSGFVVYKLKDLEEIKMDINNSVYQAQILVQLLKKEKSYLQVPYHSDATRAESNVFKPKNIFRAGQTLTKMMIRGY